MSIVSEINRIKVSKEDIKNAILQKGGTLSGESIDVFADGVLSIPSGGGPEPVIPEILDTDPLTFVCIGEYDKGNSYLSLNKCGYPNTKSFEYNKNDTGWQTYIEGTHIPVVVGDLVRFRSSSSLMGHSDNNYRYFSTKGLYKCGGKLNSLKNNSSSISNYDFWGLFRYCNITTAPELPADAKSYSHCRMFEGCTSLTTAPALPATTLATDCYQYMFQGCTSLTTAPALPATTLGNSCYQYMFQGCTSLTTAPALPATTLTNSCYQYMFQGCTSLTTAPALPATTLATYCYSHMFEGCTSLTTAPALPATTLATYCYQYMFQGCTSLTTAPALPATTLATYCYQYMFEGCTSLTTAPELPATTLESYCYECMFEGCTQLNYVKAMFTTTPGSSYTSYWLSGVASSGTFVKNSNATWTTTGLSGVPTGWTIEYADA